MRTSKHPSLLFLTSLGFFLVLGSQRASAQSAPTPSPTSTLPQGVGGITAASTGQSQIVTDKIAAATAPHELADVTRITVGAGGLFLSGNSRQFAGTGRFDLRIRRSGHQFSASGAANFARTGAPGEGLQTSAENLQNLARYDWFFDERWSLFLQATGRYDRFQGLDLRLTYDPGVAFYFVSEKETRIWVEGGYDGQLDIRRDDALATAGPPLAKTQYLNNARVFLGYNNHFYETVSLLADLEFIQDILDQPTFRCIFDLGLQAKVGTKLAVSTTFTVRYENRPLPGIQNTDTQGAVNILYTLM